MTSLNAENWKVAMDCEIKTLHDNHTWELTKLPENRSETKGRWVYTIKQGKQPGEAHFEARYVARGFSQIQSLDYEETFSPTTRFASIRMLLQKAVNENFHIHQMDVKGACLNASIDKDIYVQQPPGYVQSDENGTPRTCLLRKSLYGQKQSGRNWHSTLTDFLKSQGFTSNKTDPCIYTKFCENDQIIILFWVDDIIICSNTLSLITDVKNMLNSHFHMDDRGELKWFLGIDFQRLDNGNYVMSQERYLETVLYRFSMTECKPIGTPAEINLHLQPEKMTKYQTFLSGKLSEV